MDQPGNHILLRGNQAGAADRMRELLARTVQDHVADQRSNAGALEDIRQRMEGLEWLIKEVREREMPGLAARLDGLAGHLDQAAQKPPAWAETLAEHIEVLRSQVTPLAELHSLWADVSAVAENVEQALETLRAQDDRAAKLQHSLGKLQQSMEGAAGRFSRLDKAMAELTQRTAQLDKEMSAVKGRTEAGFDALDAKLTTADAKLTAADVKAGSADARAAALDTKLERLDERLDDQYDRVSEIDKGLVAMDGKLGGMASKLGPVDSKLSAVDSRLGMVDSKVGALGGRMAGVGEQVTALGEQVTALGEQVTGLGEQVTGLGGRLDSVDGRLAGQEERLAGQLEPLADELRSRPSQTDVSEAVAKIVDVAQDEVTARIGSLEETVLTLAEALLRPHQGTVREGTRI